MHSLAGLLELSPDPMLVADDSATITETNAPAESMLGVDADELSGSDLFDVLRVPAFTDEEALLDAWVDGDTRRLGRDGTVYARPADGEPIPVEVGIAHEDVSGEPRLIASLRTLTECEAASGGERTTQQRYRRLLEFSPAPIVIYDADGVIVYANRAAADLHDAETPDALVGTPALEYIHHGDRADSRAGIARVIEDGEAVEGVERRLQTVADETRHVVLSGLPTTFEGETAGQVVLSDVTELKERERELQRQNERLDRFTSIVSHDLRNPLAVLRSSLEMAETGDDEHLERSRRAVDRMEQLVDGLLTIARQGESPVETAPVSVPDVARAAWRTVGTAEADLVVETSTTVEADESRLRELLENLFGNSVTHGGEDVTVTVGETPSGFSVADDGPGIPEDDREAVFENGYSTATGGTGLGLAIVAEIADAHGWDVDLTESAGGGARFEFDCT